MKLLILIVIALFIPNMLLAKRRFRGTTSGDTGFFKKCKSQLFGSQCESGLICSKTKDRLGYKDYEEDKRCRRLIGQECVLNDHCEFDATCYEKVCKKKQD